MLLTDFCFVITTTMELLPFSLYRQPIQYCSCSITIVFCFVSLLYFCCWSLFFSQTNRSKVLSFFFYSITYSPRFMWVYDFFPRWGSLWITRDRERLLSYCSIIIWRYPRVYDFSIILACYEFGLCDKQKTENIGRSEASPQSASNASALHKISWCICVGSIYVHA